MSDSMQYQQCRQLKEEGAQCAKAYQYVQAAQLYKQAYDLCRDSYAASRYLYCSRKSGTPGAREAAKFAREIAHVFADDEYINREYVWAIYDGYLKSVGTDDVQEDTSLDDTGHDRLEPSADFRMMVKAAQRILDLTEEQLPRTLAVFTICKEAKQLRKWEVVLQFAQQLDPKTLSLEQKEMDGRRLPSDYQKWLFAITRSLLELERFAECMSYAQEAIEKFPNESLHFHRWEALAKIRTDRVEEGRSQLVYINTRFPKQWYIQNDIANVYVRLAQYDDAWLWFCRAASMPGDIKARLTTLTSMCDVLQHIERWQAAYEHLLLVWAIEKEQGYQQRTERTSQRINQFRKRHVDYLQVSPNAESNTPSISSALKPCRVSWQKMINFSRPIQRGSISFVNEEKQFGFVTNEDGRFHFKFNNFVARGRPEKGMTVEFETEDAFDQKRNQMSKVAINIRPAKEHTEEAEG